MLQNTQKALLCVCAFIGLASCSPKSEYDKFIKEQGYIPFQQPIADLGVGSMLDGSPDSLRVIAPSKRCFPEAVNGVPTEVRFVSEADIPDIAKNISFDASADVSSIAMNGTPIFKIHSGLHSLRSLDVKIEGASIEALDEMAFEDLAHSSMSDTCKRYFMNGVPFVRQALRVDKMSFQFKNESGGSIDLILSNLNEIIDIEAHVKWEISDRYTLTITSPKYIGYHLAKTSPKDPAKIAQIANSLKQDGSFDFKPVKSYRWIGPSLMKD